MIYQITTGGSGGGSFPIGVINPGLAAYGVKANWQIESTGANFTVTSGSNIVTCTTCKFQTSTFHAAAVGDDLFATNWGGSDGNYITANAVIGAAAAAPVTISSVDSDTQVHISANASANAGTTNGNAGVLAWGTDDDAAWALAKAAAYDGLNCTTLAWGGISNLNSAQFLTATCRGTSGGSTTSKYPGVQGFGYGNGAVFLLPPWFSTVGGARACNGAGDTLACFGLGEWVGISFNTLGAAGNVTVSKNIFETFNDGTYKDLTFWGGFAGSNGFVMNAGAHVVENITSDGWGVPCTNNANYALWYSNFCGNGKTNTASIVNPSGSYLISYSTAFLNSANGGVGISNSGTYISYGDALVPGGPSAAAYLGPTGSVGIFHGSILTNSTVTTDISIDVTGTGYAYADTSRLGGGATGTAWLCAATATCVAGEGNTYNANPIGTIGCAVNSVSPAACAGNVQGAFVIPTTTTTYTVNTTAITANSVVLLTPRTYTGNLPSAPTCVAPAVTSAYVVSAISAGTSFTMTLPSTTGQTCWDYKIVNN